MNLASALTMCVGLMLHLGVSAQKPHLALHQKMKTKPLLFNALPEKISINATQLRSLMSRPVGEEINIQLSSQLTLKGKIVEKNQQTAGVMNLNIRAENWQNALLNINYRLLADNSVAITASMVHPRFGDALVLNKDKEQFYFRKRATHLYMPE